MIRKNLYLLLIISTLLMVASCATPIRKVVDGPQDFSDQTITVQGTVIDTLSLPLRDEGIYRIRQDNSSLWIFSKKIPKRGEFVTIRGEVKTGFEIAGRNFGVILIER